MFLLVFSHHPVNSVGKVVLALVFRLIASENGSITAQGSEYTVKSQSTAQLRPELRTLQKSLSLHLILPITHLEGGRALWWGLPDTRLFSK